MFNYFCNDLDRGDAVARLIYKRVFLSDDALGYSSDEALFVGYDDDSALQYAGADIVVFPNAKKECFVEIKCAVDSAGPKRESGESLKTFAHELSYVNCSNKLRAGWLLDDDKQSDVFVYCWIPEVQTGLSRETGASYYRIRGIEDIEVLEVAMVQTERLMKYIACDVLDEMKGRSAAQIKRKLLDEATRIRREGKYYNHIGILRASYSGRLREKPVNLLIPKSDLLKMAFHAYRIKRLTYSGRSSRTGWAVINWGG